MCSNWWYLFLSVAALLTWRIGVRAAGNREQAWLPWFSLGLPTQQPAQLSEAPTLLGSTLWADLTDVEVKTRWGKGAGQHCPVVFSAFPERDSEAGFLIPVATWVSGVFLGRHHVCWLSQCCFDSAIQWPQSLQLFTVELWLHAIWKKWCF